MYLGHKLVQTTKAVGQSGVFTLVLGSHCQVSDVGN